MFSSKNKNDNDSEGLYDTTIIGKDLKFNGDIDSVKNVRLDGKMDGKINCQAKLIIGRTGSLTGEIITQDAEIYGYVNGKIKVFGILELKKGSNIQGEIFTENIISEQGAKFNGRCCMNEIEKNSVNKQNIEIFND
ncbi:MAG: polymer-forming cytoskeletal protein [Cytophagales bacterium]|jgi:cytoskeletal protein CcmA (bactofilin family)|nr:polymer-forming cytoskeletal protein [Cytophagales bacterium]